MRLFIDCEFNGGRGELISLALVAEDGREFYEVLRCLDPIEWVEQNVMPILNKEAIGYQEMQGKLHTFLQQFPSIDVVADHPADLHYFCDALIWNRVGDWMKTGDLTFRIVPNVDYVSAIPHNALEDARAIARTLA